MGYFNSRPSARGDRAGLAVQNAGFIISIHAPPRGATWRWSPPPSALVFQFTPLREGRPGAGRLHHRLWYFNSRPSARGDYRSASTHALIEISIHAPPRGATPIDYHMFGRTFISIHAPPRGATASTETLQKILRHFNSRPSARGDRRCAIRLQRCNHFNSRPSARGDTQSNLRACPSWTFQFTPLREGRRTCTDVCGESTLFQFTPLREGRRRIACATSRVLYFNSRPSARGDRAASHNVGDGAISIHAPPRGATICWVMAWSWKTFQFTPLREGRRKSARQGNGQPTFQFTPLREGRHALALSSTLGEISIHAPPRGATRAASHNVGDGAISIHAPPRGATKNVIRMRKISRFQFTPLREGRPAVRERQEADGVISIHAPPRGATAEEVAEMDFTEFQFTPLREGRPGRKCSSSSKN